MSPPHADDPRTAVLLVAHGSRRPEANDDLRQLAEILRAKGAYPIVEAAYLELAEPDIPQGAARCVAQGAARVKMLPYFLSAGLHVADDLEASCCRLSQLHPKVQFVVCPPLGIHPLMIDIVLDRLTQEVARAGGNGSA